MKILKIYLNQEWQQETHACPWALCEQNGTLLQSGSNKLSELPSGHHCVAILSAESVLQITIKQPAGSRRQWLAALPFIAEEHSMRDPAENHVVPGKARKDGQLTLYILDKSWLKKLITSCQQAGVQLRQMVCETQLLTLQENTWGAVWHGSHGFVRCNQEYGIALDSGDIDQPPLALSLLLKASHTIPPQKLIIHPTLNSPEAPQWHGLNLPTEIAPANWDWRRSAIDEESINLLWGEFSPQTRLSEIWPKFKPLCKVAAAALALHLLALNVQWLIMASEQQQLKQSMEQDFRAAFGESSVLVNAPLQMQRNLATLRHQAGESDPGDLLSLLDHSSAILSTLPKATIQAINYEPGRLDLQLKVANSSELTAIVYKLQASGLKTEMTTARNNQTLLSLQAAGYR